MGLPLYSKFSNSPRHFSYQPEPKGWVRLLAWESTAPAEDGDEVTEEVPDIPEAEGRWVRMCNPGISPCTRETIKYDRHPLEGFVKLRCADSGPETFVHRRVVLHQSKWIRDRAGEPAPSADPTRWREDTVKDALGAAPISIPSHVRWWHVAWAVNYMYEGCVPAFHLLAGEEWPARCPCKRPRSIVWGLLELWEAGHFFGLDGLKERAKGAFVQYLCAGIDSAVADHRTAMDLGSSRASASGGIGWHQPHRRVGFEFVQAVWRLYGDPDAIPLDYFHMHMSEDGFFGPDYTAEDEDAIWQWQRTIFDMTDAQYNEGDPYTQPLVTGPLPHYRAAFRPIMMELCARMSRRGLFELGWFQETVSKEGSGCPVGFRTALDEDMKASPARWPMDEYPGAPDGFERLQPESQ